MIAEILAAGRSRFSTRSLSTAAGAGPLTDVNWKLSLVCRISIDLEPSLPAFISFSGSLLVIEWPRKHVLHIDHLAAEAKGKEKEYNTDSKNITAYRKDHIDQTTIR
jgi:hypothetical protein